MVQHSIKTALPIAIFQYAFPGYRGRWAFDNATNHSSYDPQAPVASQLSLNSGSQARMQEGFEYNSALPQAMVYPDDHCNPSLRGQAKGLKKSLRNVVFSDSGEAMVADSFYNIRLHWAT